MTPLLLLDGQDLLRARARAPTSFVLELRRHVFLFEGDVTVVVEVKHLWR